MTRHRGFPSTLLVAAGVLLLAATGARAGGTSAWDESAHAKARLVAAGPAPAADAPALLAGIEIALAPQFITYWRDPGDAGVPPRFGFSGSDNLASATVRYPTPAMIDEAGATAYGYRDHVVFPVIVTPTDPAKPVRLHVRLDYAACHDICLPAKADLDLALDASGSTDAARVRDALAAVPQPSSIGATGGSLAILAVTPDPEGFAVEARGAEGATLFVEAPEGWAYAAALGREGPGGRRLFPVKRLDGPEGATAPAGPILLTLVAPGGAIAVPVQLDAVAPKP